METRSSRSPLLVPAGARKHRGESFSSASTDGAEDVDNLDGPTFEVELASNPAYSEAEKSPDDNDVFEHVGRRRSTRWFSRHRQVTQANRQCMGRYYLIYCIFCLVLTGVLLAVAVWECMVPKKEARFWRRELRVWEETAEAFVGAALCTETFAVLLHMGPLAFFRDRWRLLDSMIASLTMLCGVFFVLRRAVHGAQRVIEDVDVPILALRFALQPVRMISTASMVVRAHRKLNSEAQKTPLEVISVIDPRRHSPLLNSVLTPSLASQVRELLPNSLQHMDWSLAYSPRVHGTSLKTFYRRQAGPNVLVVRDADGGIFGGFATEAWRLESGAYGNFESFVFVVRSGAEEAKALNGAQQASAAAPVTESPLIQEQDPTQGLTLQDAHQGQQVDVFWARLQKGNVIQWSDSHMLGLGHAVVVKEDFLRGTSCDCKSFGSKPLSLAGTDFVIRDFECWHVGIPPCAEDE